MKWKLNKKIQWMKVQIISYCLPCTISTPIFPNFQVMHVTPICITAPKHCCLRAPVRIPRLKSPIIKLDFNFCSHLPNTVCSIFKSSSDFFFLFAKKMIQYILFYTEKRVENNKINSISFWILDSLLCKRQWCCYKRWQFVL